MRDYTHVGRDDFLPRLVPHYPSFPPSGELVHGAGAPAWVPIKLWTANRNAHLGFCEWVHMNPGVDCQLSTVSARSHELLGKRRHQSEQPLPDYLCSHTPSCHDITFQCVASGYSARGCYILFFFFGMLHSNCGRPLFGEVSQAWGCLPPCCLLQRCQQEVWPLILRDFILFP